MFIGVSSEERATSFIEPHACRAELANIAMAMLVWTCIVLHSRALGLQDRVLDLVHCESTIVHAEPRLVEG